VFCSFLDQVEINRFFAKKKLKNQSPGLCKISLTMPMPMPIRNPINEQQEERERKSKGGVGVEARMPI
jgi:hypothetical protein